MSRERGSTNVSALASTLPSEPIALRRLLEAAAAHRASLARSMPAHRWVDDAADGLPDVTVDRYGDYAVLAVRSDAAAQRTEELGRLLVELGVRGVYVKIEQRGDRRRADREQATPSRPLAGEGAPDPLVVSEGTMRFAVRLGEGFGTGLFLDQRDGRALVSSLSEGRSVLNLFSYAGSFTVAAAVGGAVRTASVDASRKALGRVRENLELNGLGAGEHALYADDVLDFLPRAVRKQRRFDLVVLDPPSFGTGTRKTFVAPRDYGSAAADAMRLLNSAGALYAVSNHRATSPERFRAILLEAAREARREVRAFQPFGLPVDFRHRPEGRPPTKSVLLTLA